MREASCTLDDYPPRGRGCLPRQPSKRKCSPLLLSSWWQPISRCAIFRRIAVRRSRLSHLRLPLQSPPPPPTSQAPNKKFLVDKLGQPRLLPDRFIYVNHHPETATTAQADTHLGLPWRKTFEMDEGLSDASTVRTRKCKAKKKPSSNQHD